MEENKPVIPDEVVMTKIYKIRGQKVMLDRDLAELYGVKAIRLREQVKRNKVRFPINFMFRLTEEEVYVLVSQNAIPSKKVLGGSLPLVFTEHGILMLANVLRGERAIQMSIRIIEVFVKMREILFTHKDILIKMEQMEYLQERQGEDIEVIFKYLEKLLKKDKQKESQAKRKRIGYKRD